MEFERVYNTHQKFLLNRQSIWFIPHDYLLSHPASHEASTHLPRSRVQHKLIGI